MVFVGDDAAMSGVHVPGNLILSLAEIKQKRCHGKVASLLPQPSDVLESSKRLEDSIDRGIRDESRNTKSQPVVHLDLPPSCKVADPAGAGNLLRGAVRKSCHTFFPPIAAGLLSFLGAR
jgi:hypothetical protein